MSDRPAPEPPIDLEPGSVLMIVDLQRAIDAPVWGRRGQPEAEANIAALLAAWRARGWPVIHIRHDSVEPDSPYRPDGPSHAFKPEAMPLDGEAVIPKRTNSAFIGTDLGDRLAAGGHRCLVIAGVLLENSVEATVRMAGNLGYRVLLPADATASIDRRDVNGRPWPAEDVHALTLSILDGEYATVVDTQGLLRAAERLP